MNFLDDLLGDLLVVPHTPAKAANPANRQHSCGLLADAAPANVLRILANPTLPPDPDSQEFAALRNSATTPQSEETRGDSQNSQDSQGVFATAPVSACGSPVEAGLADRLMIVWAPENHAATCPACTPTSPTKAPGRPYRLTRDKGDAAHATAWEKAVVARFQAREARLLRLGFNADNAADLAEAAHLRDVSGDNRVCCWQCKHLRRWRCYAQERAGLTTAEVAHELAVMPQRCAGFDGIDPG